jgi:pyruvate dehydrogenase E2 component (dihydrolipoamide acetyltransferase)
MADVVMPRLSDTMEEGTILSWLIADGEQVRRGQELVEIETDKATMNYESDLEGILETVAGVGETLAVGMLIARIGEAKGAAETPIVTAASASTSGAEDEEPASATAGVRAVDGGSADRVSPTAVPTSEVPPGERLSTERVKASPLARRIAEESGVDLHTVTGSGPGGRIVKADVLQTNAGPSPAQPLTGVATAKGETSTVELSRTQQTIARRMAESKATIPEFTLQSDVDMEECVKLRTELKRLSHADAPTYNDMVVKACALALREHPRANSSYRDGRLQLHARVNIGIAVATPDALVVPTVFDAEEKSLGEIARETHALADRVRDGSITPPELGGGTFTVSNLGMFGVSSFTAIINPPQAGILSVGALAPRAVVSDGEIIARHTLTLTLACDHRILYGADAAQFLARVRELLQTPSALTL